MPPSFFSPDTTWTGTQILLSEQHCGPAPGFLLERASNKKPRQAPGLGKGSGQLTEMARAAWCHPLPRGGWLVRQPAGYVSTGFPRRQGTSPRERGEAGATGYLLRFFAGSWGSGS